MDSRDSEDVLFADMLRTYPTHRTVGVCIHTKCVSSVGIATIFVTDQLGKIEARVGEGEWDASQTFGAVYFVSIEIDGMRESIEVRIQR